MTALVPQTAANQVPAAPAAHPPAQDTTTENTDHTGAPVTQTRDNSATAIVASPKTFREKTAEAAGAATKLAVPAGIVAAASSIGNWPILGKIPYLPEAAQWIQKGILSASDFLGMNTGTLAAAPHSWLAALPTFVGPTAVAAGGLWGLGKFNELLTGREKSGFNVLKTMWNGARSVYDLPKFGLGKVWGWTSSPFTRKENILNRSAVGLRNIVRDWAWNPLIKPIISPTKLGVGAGILGALLGNAATGGSSLIIGGTLYGIGNYLTNKGHLAGSSAAPAASH